MIRPIERQDFDEVLDMMKVFYASDALLIHPEESVLRKTLEDAIEAGPYVEGFIFCEKEKLAGYGMIAKSYSTEMGGRCVWIEDIYIKPEHRGKGLGTNFLQFVEDRFQNWAVRLRLEAEEDNEKAMAVYRNAGYEPLGYVQLVKEI